MFMLFLCIWIDSFFIWRPGNLEPFISSSWNPKGCNPKAICGATSQSSFSHYAEEQLDSFHWTLYSSPYSLHAQSSYTTSPSSQRSLVLFYSAVNAISCCVLVFHLLWVARLFSSPISLYFDTSYCALVHFSFSPPPKNLALHPAAMFLTFSQGSRLKLAPKVFQIL